MEEMEENSNGELFQRAARDWSSNIDKFSVKAGFLLTHFLLTVILYRLILRAAFQSGLRILRGPRCLVIRFRLWNRRVPLSKPDSTDESQGMSQLRGKRRKVDPTGGRKGTIDLIFQRVEMAERIYRAIGGDIVILEETVGGDGLVVWFQPRGRRVPGSKPDSTEEPPCKRAWCMPNPSGRNVGSLERRLPVQVSPPPSDRGSKLRGPSKIALLLLQNGTFLNPDNCSVFRSELLTIREALDFALRLETSDTYILTNSKSSIQYLKNWPKIPEKTGQEIISKIVTLSQKSRVCIQWIPSHVGVFGNEVADLLAKEGSALPFAASGELVASEIFFIHRAKANSTWKVPRAHEWYAGNRPGLSLQSEGTRSA
ncbi:hypothetical protein AVEN_207229-1 [Araneus ventricosus]|uniref:RNase H type-1 domain-containing protein n=1 Tax=Araneus ventricosus TaxID=182803 RepID=A0A4Y2IB72_ARAVE|nr:hypothetical protein AVEN_207229-1 [Araneus ventricosus]